MFPATPTGEAETPHPRLPAIVFGTGIAALVLFLLAVVINARGENDFPREAWGPYQTLFDGHPVGFLRSAPAYVGSLVLRAPFALAAHAFGAGMNATYIATALPCVIAPALLAGWLVSERCDESKASGHNRRLWPLDLFMFTPPVIICITEGHPEEILGATLCVAAVLLAHRGSVHPAGILLALALINKSWAAIAAPLVFVLMPSGRRLAGFGTTVLGTALIMLPVLAIRASSPSGSGGGLGQSLGGHALIPQLLWFFGSGSWIDRNGHFILVLAGWLVSIAWWWLRLRGAREHPSTQTVLQLLALVFFLRAALDPWDNGYYFVPFMLTIMVLEERLGGFPKLSWAFPIMLVIVVPPAGLLNSLGNNGHAAAFAIWALAVIAYFSRRAFTAPRPLSTQLYAAASRSGA